MFDMNVKFESEPEYMLSCTVPLHTLCDLRAESQQKQAEMQSQTGLDCHMTSYVFACQYWNERSFLVVNA